MDVNTLQEMLRAKPFKPFVVRLSSGDVHLVRHPEFAFVLKSNMVIGYPESDRVAVCSTFHIASVETLQPS